MATIKLSKKQKEELQTAIDKGEINTRNMQDLIEKLKRAPALTEDEKLIDEALKRMSI